jgi:cell division protein FtsZ
VRVTVIAAGFDEGRSSATAVLAFSGQRDSGAARPYEAVTAPVGAGAGAPVAAATAGSVGSVAAVGSAGTQGFGSGYGDHAAAQPSPASAGLGSADATGSADGMRAGDGMWPGEGTGAGEGTWPADGSAAAEVTADGFSEFDERPGEVAGRPSARPFVPRPAEPDSSHAARVFDAATTRRRPVVFEEDDDLDVPDFLK